MDFTEINSRLDAAINFFEGVADREKSYKQQIADRDKQIADLQAQLTTASNTIQADEGELTQLHDKLAKLAELVNPVAATVS
ncbi:hypothetical protein [Nostoc sp. ChiVER01]|uniref:hypothetical protein n=1 Tax=Nostoc sp. ChiVER01 TaxID=3075382 RepID=UPI002AD46E3D|nr:hypothetical protein [Nostoc sp. ChiVER01]MDZ8225775.1 hypothetical protein [Nostoc sp. ChiVER01]